MNKVILYWPDGGTLTIEFNEDIRNSEQINFNGSLFTFRKGSAKADLIEAGGLPIYDFTMPPHTVTRKRLW